MTPGIRPSTDASLTMLVGDGRMPLVEASANLIQGQESMFARVAVDTMWPGQPERHAITFALIGTRASVLAVLDELRRAVAAAPHRKGGADDLAPPGAPQPSTGAATSSLTFTFPPRVGDLDHPAGAQLARLAERRDPGGGQRRAGRLGVRHLQPQPPRHGAGSRRQAGLLVADPEPFLESEQVWVLPRWSRTVLDHLVAEPHPFGRPGPARKLRCPPASWRPGSLTARALVVRPGR